MKTKIGLIGLIALFASGAVCALQGGEEGASAVGKPLAAAAANVRDFGTKGDGETDDTAALRKAVDSLAETGGALYFPPGVYRTGTLKPASHVTLAGHSGWGYGRGRLTAWCVTIAEVLREAGYDTLITGKWHVGYLEPQSWPLRRGFDRYYGGLDGPQLKKRRELWVFGRKSGR